MPSFPRVDEAVAAFDAGLKALRALRAPGDARDKEWVKRRLAQLCEEDQFMRGHVPYPDDNGYSPAEKSRFFELFGPRWSEVDVSNTAALKELLAVHGWFTIDAFGPQADQDAWLLVQHADHDVAFQEEVLARLEALLPSGGTRPHNYAYLFDRVAVARDRPQRYGTQGRCVGKGLWEPDPMEEPERVDERRAAVGLPPMAEYKAHFRDICRGAD
ncbi:MAG: hypothetical protein KGL53_13225 [Elusimicrobia bacterium]|nr:hypothetical protein [Elusimicrobiota bacterium]